MAGAEAAFWPLRLPKGTAFEIPAGGASPPGLAQVQNNIDTSGTAHTSFSVNITTQPGDLLVAFVRESSNGTDNFTLTDSAGQTWTQTSSGYESESPTGPRIGMFYVANSAAVTSVTAHYATSGGVVKPGIMVMELSGAALSSVLDASVNNATQASVTTSSGSALSTSNPSDILIFATDVAADQFSGGSCAPGWCAGTGFTIPNNNLATGGSGSDIRMAMQYAMVFSAQSNSTTSMTYDNPGYNGNIFAAFKAAPLPNSLSILPSTLTFASQMVGSSSGAQPAVLYNGTSSSVSISSMAISGPNGGDFVETNNCGTSLAAGASCTIEVTFTPSLTGAETATLSVSDSATNSPQTTSITGTGTGGGGGGGGGGTAAPVANLSPALVDFGNQNVGSAAPSQTLTLSNSGNAALSIAGIAISGSNSGDFNQTDSCGSSLAAGASCAITVTFTPSVAGPRNGTLTVTDNAAGSPQTASLTGTGTAFNNNLAESDIDALFSSSGPATPLYSAGGPGSSSGGWPWDCSPPNVICLPGVTSDGEPEGNSGWILSAAYALGNGNYLYLYEFTTNNWEFTVTQLDIPLGGAPLVPLGAVTTGAFVASNIPRDEFNVPLGYSFDGAFAWFGTNRGNWLPDQDTDPVPQVKIVGNGSSPTSIGFTAPGNYIVVNEGANVPGLWFATPIFGFITTSPPQVVTGQFASGSLGQLPPFQIVIPGAPSIHLTTDCNGPDITNKTEDTLNGQPIVTGERIELCGSPGQLPSGVSVTDQTWSPGGTTAGGFNPNGSPSNPGGYTGADFKQTSTTFYWLSQGKHPVQFTVKLSDGSTSSAIAWFNVAGPTGVSVSATTPAGQWQIPPPPAAPALACGQGIDPAVCISFKPTAKSPSQVNGTYEWIQFVTQNTMTLTSGSTTIPYNCGTGLDNEIPYTLETEPFAFNTADSPANSLQSASSYNEEERTKRFTMYLMWNPGLDGTSIPVPLWFVTWQATGDATSDGSTWTINQSKSSSGVSSSQASSSPFPQWTNVLKNGQETCTPQ